jgi:hypothetical protein
MCSCNFWQLIANNMTKVPLATSMGLELFFVHMMGIPTTSSKIIGKQLVLSLCKQLRLRCSRVERIERWPLVSRAWNCISGNFFCMANSFAREQLKATWNKFDVNRIGLNLEVVVIILNSICFKLMASTSWLLGILMQNLWKDITKSKPSCCRMIFVK